MDNTSFASKLIKIEGFQRKYLPVVIESVSNQFINLITSNKTEEHDWNYLITCASAFALSEESVCLDTAFRIAHVCLSSETTSEEQKAGAAVVLDRLTNSPSLKLAIERGYLSNDYADKFPTMFQLERINRGIQYSVIGKDMESLISVNRFQADVYNGSRETDWLSVSAPTSSGKSFILLEILNDFLKNEMKKIVVYIVPTRSLIQQVENDVAQSILEHEIENVFITSVPLVRKENTGLSFIFVLTQERYLWLLNEEPSLIVNLLVVDEAQKIGDGARGVLLQQVIDETVRRSENVKVIFSSPMTSNPEILLGQAPTKAEKRPILSEHIAVNQNLIWASEASRTKWNMDLCLGSATLSLGTFELPFRPTSEGKRLPFVVHALSDKSGGNLVYVNGPAEAEKTALLLYDLQATSNNIGFGDTMSDLIQLTDLIELVKKAIHPNYTLATVLGRGVAFHYGNMPLLVKNEIERLFKAGIIKFLVCTSTLIEGVNLPAKSIFVRKPKKGNRTPMGEIDFWNLAGRAGRQGKEFQGNVICIDPILWTVEPPREKIKFPIRPTLDSIIVNKASDLIEFIELGTPRDIARNNLDLEHTFVYFFSDYLRYGTVEGHKGLLQMESGFSDRIDELFKGVVDKIELPDEIIFQNAGISPLAQQDLLEYFRRFEGDPETLIPAFPENVDALDNYVRVINRIGTYLSGDTALLDYYHAILVLYWMRGKSLSFIIGKNWAYWRTRNRSLPRVIRDSMQHIEEFARFKFVKFSSCYTDVLKVYFEENNRQDLIEEIPKMNIWLEFGASQATQISLMSLGLSRTSSIALSEFIVADGLDVSECLKWLESLDTSTLDISSIIITELTQVVERHGITKNVQ
ncbi:DEAD/DEAH box helicase [Paenibacillus sp. LHD-38]|uniref:DEAD/DEAH box helicase n=1 Tax=Paenibacillus sp. LHD-38 TaxID=3072143 RepID=UPI00280F5156|nr:DEAD/DEAH box helicase [Paenibacillus sp. LHD-38]MDQ8738245.1 DEAD/DEAH box helicase [Paenibacillus sp. LHD-38]